MAKQLGKYEILRTLGQGAMGEVYLAHHPTIGRDVAIKTILPSAARGDDAEDRFRREAAAAGKLNHPNLVTIYDFDKDGDVLYLVMEYVKGDDLEDLILNRELSQSQFLEVLAQICDGLSFAHRSGIIHRDIKPSNVRVIRDGKRLLAKVMDFGIARVEDSGMTATGIVMGTVSYMAPEYIQSGKAVAQCDLWAVGVMLYEYLAGRKPFFADNTTTILFKIVSETPKPIEPDAIQGVSLNIRAVIDKALAKDPAQRFQTADDFAKALRACKDPGWTGTIEEATALITSHQVAAGASGDHEERPLGAPSSPTVISDVPASSVASGSTVEAATTVLASRTTTRPSESGSGEGTRSGSRIGLYVGIACGVALLAGGGWFLLGRGRSAAALPTAAQPQPLASVQSAPGQGGTGQGGTGQAANTPAGATAASPSVAMFTPNAGQPTPSAAGTGASHPPTATPHELPKHEQPKPVEETPAQKLDKAIALIRSNPGQAASTLRVLAAASADPQVQGNYLAALYRSRNVGEFERVWDASRARGLNLGILMKAAPAFRQAMVDESAAQKAKNGSNILSASLMKKVTQ